MLVTPLGIVTLVKFVQRWKAYSPMLVTATPPIVDGIFTSPPAPLYLVIVPVEALNSKSVSDAVSALAVIELLFITGTNGAIGVEDATIASAKIPANVFFMKFLDIENTS